MGHLFVVTSDYVFPHNFFMQTDRRWNLFRVTPEFLQAKSIWLAAERDLHSSSLVFFRDAGKLLSLSQADYELSNLAFFLSILGVERALRLHYRDETEPFKQLLIKAVSEGLITDSIFQWIQPLSKDLNKLVDLESRQMSHAHKLSSLIPALRNEFFHGIYYLMPEMLALTLQLREIADVLQTYEFPRTCQAQT